MSNPVTRDTLVRVQRCLSEGQWRVTASPPINYTAVWPRISASASCTETPPVHGIYSFCFTYVSDHITSHHLLDDVRRRVAGLSCSRCIVAAPRTDRPGA